MAKKSKNDAKKKADDPKARRRADDAAAKKARAKAEELAAVAKKARKAADKAVKAADKAEAKAAGAAAAAGRPVAAKPDELGLAKLALRATEAKLTSAEIRIEQLQQQLDGERRLQDEALQVVLEDSIVDAAVQATVEEAVVDALVEAETAGEPVDAVVVETVAVDLESVAAQTALPPEEPWHEGDAERAASAFVEAGPADEPAVVPSELTPPLPETPAPTEPSEQWTLLRLREEAKRRGLTGTSNLPKAALLERLRAG